MNSYGRFFLLLLLAISLTTKAQERLKGKWVSYSLSYRGRERAFKEKQDKTRFVFDAGGNYTRYDYIYDRDPNSLTLIYSFPSGEVKDTNGKVLKKKKVKEKGSYQVSENNIVFVTSNDRYSAQYKWEGETLLLTFTYDSLSAVNYTLRFRRD